MPEIQSRVLNVEVSAKRAKQLRRGALPRLAHLRPDPETGARVDTDVRLERVAMQEVKEGRIVFELPDQAVEEKATK
jgi:DNA-directed RNA polymerase subunit K/omega